jgi:hypothetical protein
MLILCGVSWAIFSFNTDFTQCLQGGKKRDFFDLYLSKTIYFLATESKYPAIRLNVF